MKILTALTILIITFAAHAQELDDIITDRPDQTESAVTVPKGFFQIETGGMYESEYINHSTSLLAPSFRIKTISAPSVLVRYGLLKNIELRLGAEYINQSTDLSVGADEKQSGLSPLTFGTKIQIAAEKQGSPGAAFLFNLSIPLKKNDPFQPEYVGADFRISIAHTLSDKFALSYNVGGEWDGDNPRATGIYTLSLGISLGQKLSMFLESYGFLPQGESPDHRLDGGFTFLLARNIQIDVSGGIGLMEASPDYFIGAGVAFRLPR